MILPRGVVLPFAFLVAVATVTITFNVGIGEAPARFFGGADAVVIGPPGGGVPGRDPLEAASVPPLRALPYVDVVSPEVFAITVMEGRSIFVRGADEGPFLALEDATVASGRMPATPYELAAGEAIARRMGVALGSRLVVPSAFDRTAAAYDVVGIVSTSGPARDELIATVEGARRLTNLPPDAVHVIRVVSRDPERLTALLDSRIATFTYSDVQLSDTNVFVDQPILMRANLTNWGVVDGSKRVEVRENDTVIAVANFLVPAQSTIAVEVPFTRSSAGVANISVNPEFLVTVREPLLLLRAEEPPPAQDRPFVVQATDLAGIPLAGVPLRLQEESLVTDATGRVAFTPARAGNASVVATYEGETAAVLPIFVGEAFDRPSVVVRALTPPTEAIGANATASFRVRIENRGAPGEVSVNLTVDGVDVAGIVARLTTGETTEATIVAPPMDEGLHTIGTRPEGPTITVKSYGGRDPRAQALLEAIKAREESAQQPVASAEARDFVDRLLGNVAVAVVALSVAAGALTALALVAVLSRHVAERAPTLGALKAMGATDSYVVGRATREAMLLGALGAVVGIASGVLLANALAASGIVRAFGHTISPASPWNVLAMIFVGATTFLLLATRALVGGALARDVDDLLQGRILRPTESEAPTLRAVLDGELS